MNYSGSRFPWARRAVSRFLYPGQGRGGSHSSRSAIAGGLKQPTRNFGCRPEPSSRGRGGSPLVPYLVLLRVGFTLPPRLPEARCALTAPFHPYPGGCRGGTFSVALSVNYPLRVAPRPLAGTLPCGDRTFLPAVRRGGCPFGGPKLILALHLLAEFGQPMIRPQRFRAAREPTRTYRSAGLARDPRPFATRRSFPQVQYRRSRCRACICRSAYLRREFPSASEKRSRSLTACANSNPS